MVGLLFAQGIEGVDQRVSLWINSHFCTFGDAFWMFMSGVKVWIPLYAIVAALLVWRLGWKKGLVAIACIGLAFFLNERVNNLVKHLVERVRPGNDPLMVKAGIHILQKGGGWSFPSGHACNSFGFAFASALCFKFGIAARAKEIDRIPARADRILVNAYGIFIISWAVLVGISRIMVARHYLGDVLVGALIGSLMGAAWAIAARLCFTRVAAFNR